MKLKLCKAKIIPINPALEDVPGEESGCKIAPISLQAEERRRRMLIRKEFSPTNRCSIVWRQGSTGMAIATVTKQSDAGEPIGEEDYFMSPFDNDGIPKIEM